LKKEERGGTGRWPSKNAAEGSSADNRPARGSDAKKLFELARLYGIQTSYLDMAKQRQQADPEALLLVLRAMGTGVEKFADVSRALAHRKDELRKRIVEPVMVAWDGKLNGRRFEFGYHETEIDGHETFVISAPKKAYFPRPALGTAVTQREKDKIWGLFVPIYALHSKRSPCAGDLTDFESVMDWMFDLGGAVAATLPLLAAFLDEPFEPSPYSPASRLFWNEFYADIYRIPEDRAGGKAQRLAEKHPRKTKYVDYRELMRYKRVVLEELARAFFSAAEPVRLQTFRDFVRQNRNVEDYARFRAVTDRLRSGWNTWPARLRDGDIRPGDYDEETKNYHLYSQWIVQEQLQALSTKADRRGQMLYLDLPLGMHPDGYDIWHDRELFVRGVSGGAPPDLVFTKGQNWNFPPMHPEAMRLNRYQYVIALIRNHLRFARLLRIDHVMGLHRLYWIPDELTGDKGVYVEYPAEELYAILSLESHRHRAGIVGENLGTVPPAVNAALARHNIRPMYVAQYELMGNPQKPRLRPVPKKSVASLNTHDMPPFRAFLEGRDIEDRLNLGLLNAKRAREERKQRKAISDFGFRISDSGQAPGDMRVAKVRNPKSEIRNPHALFRAATQFLAHSMANIVLVNLEDLWGEVFPQNVPATHKERPNWRRRIRPSIEQLRRMATVVKVLSNVFAHRSRPVPL
jgi:4-alpha-glucanotransferase